MTETNYPCWLDPGREYGRAHWVDLSTLLHHLKRLGYERTMASPIDSEDDYHVSHWRSETESSPGYPMPHQWLMLKEWCPPTEGNAGYPHAYFSWRADQGDWVMTMPMGWVLPDPDRVDRLRHHAIPLPWPPGDWVLPDPSGAASKHNHNKGGND